MSEQDVKSRLRLVLEAHNENPTRLAKRFSVNQTTLNNQINKDTAIALSTILLIAQAIPEISLEWLLRGIGKMSLTSAPEENSGNIQNIHGDGNHHNTNGKADDRYIAHLEAEIELLRKEKENLWALVRKIMKTE